MANPFFGHIAFSQTISSFTNTGDASAYWEINTNFTKRPIKLLFDTGAQVTLLAENVLNDEIILKQWIIGLSGINGAEHAITTKGCLMGDLITLNYMRWPTEVHVVERINSGKFDGYLGIIRLSYTAVRAKKSLQTK